MQPSQRDPEAPRSAEHQSSANGDRETYSLRIRIRRSLARRFPRTRRAYELTRDKIVHFARAGIGRLSRIGSTFRWIRYVFTTFWNRRREKRLTIAVDVTPFWEPLTGIGWYLYRVLETLADREDLRVRLYATTVVSSPDLEPPCVELPSGAAIERMLLEVPEDLVLPAGWIIRLLRRLEPLLIAADGNDVKFAPNYFLPRKFLLARGALVATIHDLGLRKVPWTLQEETLEELTQKLERGIAKARQLITVSAAVRDEVVEYGYAPDERITVVHHGPGQLASVEPTRLPADIPDAYALHVGTLEPRKNIAGLLEAWSLVRQRLARPPALVLCGRFGWKTDEIRAAVEKGEEDGWLVHPGYVSEGELAALYRSARVVVFPSLYEGFGLPTLEAMLAGAPLVCSDIPVLREVAGDAALFAPPDRPDLLSDRIVDVLESPGLSRDLVERGYRHARDFSWPEAGRLTASVWYKARGRRPPEAHRPESM